MSKKNGKARVRVIKSKVDTYEDVIKSDKQEQLDEATQISVADWIPHPFRMEGLESLVNHSTILPQCIRAYKNNIAGFGVGIKYVNDDIEEEEAQKIEWDTLQRILDLINFEMDVKEVFEQVIESRETYGIGYVECIRNIDGQLVEIDFIQNTPSIEMTYPLEPYVDLDFAYRGELISRKKKFRKFRQNIGGKTIYFKEFGDPRVMDKNTGLYVDEGETLDLDKQANEIMDFPVGKGYYGTVRWIGTCLTVDGDFRAETLNNNYFRNGRHTPLMIIVKGGTLSDESFSKLQTYMNEIKGESGQHAFMVLETEKNETTTDFAEVQQPSIEIKDLAGILQSDGLFQEYQKECRKKVQSAFLLPDIYVGYTTDFNRATSQAAIEITEKQVFQPERISLAWQLNNKLLNGYGFKYVETFFEAPDLTNPDDMQKILNIAERAGGLTMNDARDLTAIALGKAVENYPASFDMTDIGKIPLSVIRAMPALYNYGNENNLNSFNINDLFGLKTGGTVNSGALSSNSANDGELEEEAMDVDQNLDSNGKTTEKEQLDVQIKKAEQNHDDDVVVVMKEVRKLLTNIRKQVSDENTIITD